MSPVRRQSGLTLVELLVTLVLVGMTASLVLGGIGQASGALARQMTAQGTAYHELMARAWLNQTIRAAVPSIRNTQDFAGNGTEMKLLSFQPLLGSEGIATTVIWQATAGGTLQYIEADQQFAIAALPPVERFEYQGADLVWHGEWPIDGQNGLPARVAVVFSGEQERLEIDLLAGSTALPDADGDEDIYDDEEDYGDDSDYGDESEDFDVEP